MEPILYLVHRIPYPPNKGDKIRSYHLLKYLSIHYQVYLGTFVDYADDWQYIKNVESLCKEVFVESIRPLSAKIRSLKGFITGDPLSLPYYQNNAMQSWVGNTMVNHGITQAVVYSSSMAQYVMPEKFNHLHRIIDFVDVDSDKWRQYSVKKSWPMNWVYQRESIRLLDYETKVAKSFHKSLFVSKDEAALFQNHSNVSNDKIDYYNNGVDINFFSSESLERASNGQNNPYKDLAGPIYVFTGAMDYWANADAALWFVNQVWAKVKQQLPEAQFYIVGSKPTPDVSKADQVDSVTVTGFVDDIRPYIAFADVVVAPLQIARGVQNKVLEAFAFEKRLVATAAAMEGIELSEGHKPRVADEPTAFAQHCIDILDHCQANQSGGIGRKTILDHYNWDKNLSKFSDFLLTSN